MDRAPYPVELGQAMQVDQYRLRRAWQRLNGRSETDEVDHLKWQQQLEASLARGRQRAESIPQLQFDPELPITGHRQGIVELLNMHQTIVVCGETGSGKSTQLPKLCLEAGLGVRGMIGHTQPRRLAARAVASRLAQELGTRVGDLVGFKIRFTDATQSGTLVKLMTDGVLLAETQRDRFLDHYDALIIDEAHERSLNIDFLLGYVRRIARQRPDLKLIITSATIDPQRFADHFADEQGPAPIVEVSGRTYPVEQRYVSVIEADPGPGNELDQLPAAIAAAVDDLQREGPGDVLVFLPTERDIRQTAKHLRGHFTRTDRKLEILPLYARLSNAEQNKIFAPHPHRRVVLATNVAESSLTVPGIRYVVDSGLVRISRYAPRSRVQRLPIEPVSQASANQRAGRCGRLGPGVCIRLYAEEDYQSRPKYTTPEIRRSDLASVLLQSKVLRLGPLEEFPLLDPPTPEGLRDADKTLRGLAAIDLQGELTSIGRQLGKLPCDPRIGRMLIEAGERRCLAEVVVIAAALEAQDVRQRPAGQRAETDAAHQQFADPHSDFLAYLRLWDFYDHLRADLGRSRLQKALNQKFLSYQGFREWADTVRQLKELLAAAGIPTGARSIRLPPIEPEKLSEVEQAADDRSSRRRHKAVKTRQPLERPPGYAAIHQALLTGLLSGIAQRAERYEYTAAGGIKISLWPGSALFRRTPLWIVAAEIVETTKRYGRTVAEVDVQWIEQAGAALLKHSYNDSHWSRKAGAAMVYRRSTLFGLPVVAGRRTALAPLDPVSARQMMIEHGLVAGEWDCREAFYRHNQEMLADMHELAQRTRSRDFILDRFHLAAFYEERIPTEVHDLATLRAWVRKHQGQTDEQRLWMRPEDLLATPAPIDDVATTFPNSLEIGATSFPLEYHFEPGNARDGVTLTVPQAALRQLSDEALGWLVPGLLEEKILQLIRSLPKAQRTNFVPAPDVARKLAQQLSTAPRDQAFTQSLCAAMSQHAGEKITAASFDLAKLPAHLYVLVRVVDDEGHEIGSGRDVRQLQAEHAPPVPHGVASTHLATASWENKTVTFDTFAGWPQPVMVRRGGVLVAAFPALVDLGKSVELRLVDTEQAASESNVRGITRLLALKHHRSLRSQVAHLPALSQASLQLSHLIPSKQLAEQLQDLIVRIALVEDQPPPATPEDLQARSQRAGVQITVAAQEISTWLPRLAEQAHQVRLLLEQSPASWAEVSDEVRQQQAELFADDFLQKVPWQWLSEYPRYLQAICLRFDKLRSGGGLPRDRRLREPVERAWGQYQQLRAADSPAAGQVDRLREIRWAIEELRVSIFAQQLGTKGSVSPKRVQNLIDSM